MKMNRRRFLQITGLAALGSGLPFSLAEAADSNAILVAIGLFGGNDGLSTVIPYAGTEYDLYRKLRPTLRKDKSQLQAFAIPGTGYAFNPAMAKFRKLYTAAKNPLAVIAGVGVPADSVSKFDHAAGTYDFVSADPLHLDYVERPSGFIGRVLDQFPLGRIPIGIDFGGGTLILEGNEDNRRPLSLYSIEDFQLDFGNLDEKAAYRDIMSFRRKPGSVEELNRLARRDALANSDYVRAVTKKYPDQAGLYPKPEDNELAGQLKDVAKMIWADMGARAFSLGLGGFDTHSGQNDGGFHDQLLANLSAAVYAFYADMRRLNLGEKVVVMIYSEFGRRPEENSDRGTDHGYGNVMMVLGDRVRGGFYGHYPSLRASKLVLAGNLAAPVDYRRVYATLLAEHYGVDPLPVVGFNAAQGIPFM